MKFVSHWEIKRELMRRFNCVLVKDERSGKKVGKNHYAKSIYYWLNKETGVRSEFAFALDEYARELWGNNVDVIENRKFYERDKLDQLELD